MPSRRGILYYSSQVGETKKSSFTPELWLLRRFGSTSAQIAVDTASSRTATTIAAPIQATQDVSPALPGPNTSNGSDSNGETPKPKPKTLKEKIKAIKWYWKVLVILLEVSICDFLFDKYFLGGVGVRTTIAYGTVARIGLDYKLHYGKKCWLSRHPDEDLHERNAERLSKMLKWCGGLYVKAGQALAMQGAVLPEKYQKLFGEMFDDAPHVPWRQVNKLIKSDFGGRDAAAVFGDNVFEEEPRASASIAQVHFARLADGTPVAVKIQRPEIAKQVSWDIWSLQLLADYTERVTGLPIGKCGEYIGQHLMNEVDFEHEADNAEKMAAFVTSDPSLRDRVYVPKVYRELSSKRVLTIEWVDGVQLWDKDTITNKWTPKTKAVDGIASPAGGFGLQLHDVMGTVIDLFSKQMFSWGFVHCDPHPGNILVRRHPDGSGKPQVILLDHGLCVELSPELRSQYARFWKGLVTADDASLQQISKEWGLNGAEAWADASLMRPYKDESEVDGENGADGVKGRHAEETPEEVQERMIEEARGFIGDEELFPRELFFLERVVTILQGNNRFLGSPVNRIKLIGLGAVRAVKDDGAHTNVSLRETFNTRFALAMLDFAFWWSRARQYFGYGSGFEEELKEAEERQMREAKDAIAATLGLVVD